MMIDASPKGKESNSGYFLETLNKYISKQGIVKYKLTKKSDYEIIIDVLLNSSKSYI